jgi:hypothetical protein
MLKTIDCTGSVKACFILVNAFSACWRQTVAPDPLRGRLDLPDTVSKSGAGAARNIQSHDKQVEKVIEIRDKVKNRIIG